MCKRRSEFPHWLALCATATMALPWSAHADNYSDTIANFRAAGTKRGSAV